MSQIIARQQEQNRLKSIVAEDRASFLALFGRRRIGKTFLIREFFRDIAEVQFYVTGIQGEPKAKQIQLFQQEIERVFHGGTRLPRLTQWQEAFALLADLLRKYSQEKKPDNMLVFLDELPWLATPRSGLLEALDWFWNTQAKDIPRLRLVICGSAASWMIRKVVHSKGGLHNRITGMIHLQPFRLSEVKAYFQAKHCRWTDSQILELYLALGGVPYYLDLVEPTQSAAQNIGRLCFGGGDLADELERLLPALFTDAEHHRRILRALATKSAGLTRQEIQRLTRIPSGGKLTEWIQELEQSGFIASVAPLWKKKKEALYRIIDEFTWFSLKWHNKAPKGVFRQAGSSYWAQQMNSPAYRAWSGYAFENVCLRHHLEIKSALGFGSVLADVGSWRTPDAQVDLVFDRSDRVVTLCEAKYSEQPLVIDQKLIQAIEKKIEAVSDAVHGRKQVQPAILTVHGIKRSQRNDGFRMQVTDVKGLFRELP